MRPDVAASNRPPGLISAVLSRQFLRFAITGGAAAGVNWIAGRLLTPPLGIDAAVVVAYLVGMATAYALARLFVFDRSGRSVANEGLRFAAVNVLSLAIVWGVTMGLAREIFPWLGYAGSTAEGVAHALGIAAPIVPSYLLHRCFSFAPKRPQP